MSHRLNLSVCYPLQPRLAHFPIRHHAPQQVVKLFPVMPMHRVTQLVRHHIVNARRRGRHQFWVQPHAAAPRPTAPALGHPPQLHPGRIRQPRTQPRRAFRKTSRQPLFRVRQIPALHQPSHTRRVCLARRMHPDKPAPHFYFRRIHFDNLQPVLPPQVTVRLAAQIPARRCLGQKLAKKPLLPSYPNRPLPHFCQHDFHRRFSRRGHQHAQVRPHRDRQRPPV